MGGITMDHVAVMVSDLERSLEFYREVLGLEVVTPEEHGGGPVDEMTAMKDTHVREYRMRTPGGVNGHRRSADFGFTFDLIEWVSPKSPTGRRPIHHLPSAHFCFGVEDVPATYERLKAAGVEVFAPPVRFSG